jgi:hypothetical protein
MEEITCSLCNKLPVFIKKRGLCWRCYGSEYRKDKIKKSFLDNEVIEHSKEKSFIKNYFNGRTNWIYHPCSFNIFGHGKYTPDFYDQETGFFIEVAGTRQAYDLNHEKYVAFHNTFPSILFEVRTSNGQIVDFSLERQPNMTWNYNIN